jgi:hypothetical protein
MVFSLIWTIYRKGITRHTESITMNPDVVFNGDPHVNEKLFDLGDLVS